MSPFTDTPVCCVQSLIYLTDEGLVQTSHCLHSTGLKTPCWTLSSCLLSKPLLWKSREKSFCFSVIISGERSWISTVLSACIGGDLDDMLDGRSVCQSLNLMCKGLRLMCTVCVVRHSLFLFATRELTYKSALIIRHRCSFRVKKQFFHFFYLFFFFRCFHEIESMCLLVCQHRGVCMHG